MFQPKYLIGLLNAALFLLIANALIGCKDADLNQIGNAIRQTQQPLNEKTVVAGLKQALEIASQNTVQQTSKLGGYSDNPLIKIVIPEKLIKTADTLKKIGLGHYVEQFEVQMNRAAETASVEAKAIFINSISTMSLADGWNILRGPDDAATQYFKTTTGQQLSQKFKPVITKSMAKVGFYDDYKKLLRAYYAIPFTEKPDLNIENYILEQSLNGLFVLVAQEEKKIRDNPAARVTELLQRVFAK